MRLEVIKKGYGFQINRIFIKTPKFKITIVDKPIEALAHYSYIGEQRQYISLFEADESTFEYLKFILNQTNTSIYLSSGISLENFEKEFKLLISLLSIDAKFMLSNFNEIKIWISNTAEKHFLDLIKRIKKVNTENVATAINTLGDEAKNHIKNDMILVTNDDRNNLIVQIPKNFKSLYQFQHILIKALPSRYTIVTEKPKYMNWVLQNQKGLKLKSSERLIIKQEIFLTNSN